MGKREIKKALKAANVTEHEIHGSSSLGYEVEIFDETEAQKFMEKTGWGGYKTGYDSWVVREGYKASGDWNNRASRHHY